VRAVTSDVSVLRRIPPLDASFAVFDAFFFSLQGKNMIFLSHFQQPGFPQKSPGFCPKFLRFQPKGENEK